MLSFAMATRNEGRALDDTLRMLGATMAPEDHLIAIDAGSTDRTVARLMEFAERAPCTVLQLDTPEIRLAQALLLALDSAQTAYVMWLGPRDHLRPEALSDLRQCLEVTAPDLAVTDSGWWYATPDRVWPRADAARAATLPPDAAKSTLLALCPDPRRLVIARRAEPHLRPILNDATSDPTLYAALVAAATRPAFVAAPVMLHALDSTDPAPQLEALRQHLPADSQAALHMITVWSDDAVLRTAPDQAEALCAQLLAVWQALPPALQDAPCTHNGPSAALFAALRAGGIRDAMLHFALSALARQQQQSAHLAAENTQLRHEVQAALPGPDYLRRLYDRARNI